MERGPKYRLVQRVTSECLSRIRRFGGLPEEEFGRGCADLPGILRDAADGLDGAVAAPEGHPEPAGWTGYDLWAAVYDTEEHNPVVAGEEEVIRDVIGDPAGLRVLDVGCGTGRHAVRLARAGARVVGYDPSAGMLGEARRKAQQERLDVELHEGALDDLPKGAGRFDLVLCCLVLSHVEDIDGAVAVLAEHLADGGRLVVSDFHPFNLLIGWRTCFTVDGATYVVPNYLHLPSDYFAAMRGAGLSVTRLLEPGRLPALPGMPMALVVAGQRP